MRHLLLIVCAWLWCAVALAAGPIYVDRVQETTTTSGTGTYTLNGATTGYQAFSAVGNGNTAYYSITDGTNWEVGLGTYTLSGTTLARTSILSSSNSNSAVSWSAGVKYIWLDTPAAAISAFGSVKSVICAATTITSTGTCYSAGQVVGSATNDSATTGNFGEDIDATLAVGSAISAPNTTATNVTSLTLTAGDWDLSGQIGWNSGAGSPAVLSLEGSISPTSATRNQTAGQFESMSFGATGVLVRPSVNIAGSISPFRVSLSGSVTYYLVAFPDYSAGTWTVFGTLHARRMR